MNKHTPGLWVYRPDPNSNPGDHPQGDYVVGVGDDIDSVAVTSPLANARLIAAAPELLVALESMLLLHDCGASMAGNVSDVIESARAAIAKATGAQA